MTTITTRAGKGSALTHTELDDNFTNLNTAKLEAGNVANVAISGSYTDLTNKPTIPTHTSNLTNDSGFITSAVTGNLSATGNISGNNITATTAVYTPQIESATSLDINSPNEVNVNANVRVGDNNTDTQIATHGTGDLILRTHQGDANQGNIRLYDGASGNIDVNPNGTGKINLNGGVFSADGITATGNVTGSYIVGNGSLLSNITGANVTGTVANATYATSAGSATTATSATTAGTVTGNAQANITSVGTLSSLTVSGNIGTGGILTDGYYYANGTPVTFGSNSFSTIDANGTSIVADSTSDTLTLAAGSGITITGNAATDTITITATGGGGGTPGGADTQIQFNDASAFAGNAQMTFSKTTGNAAFGNLVIKSTSPNSAAVITNVNAINASARPLLGRIAIGSGFDGDWGSTGDYLATTRNSAVTSMNRFSQSSASNTAAMIGTSVATWFDNSSGATITGAGNTRGLTIDTFYTGANRWGTQNSTGAITNIGLRVNTVAGNGTSGGSVGTLIGSSLQVGTASNNAVVGDCVSTLVGQIGAVSGGNNGNVYGITFSMSGTNPTVGNCYLIHNQATGSGTHSTSGWGMGGNFRSASRYFFIRNDDDAAQVKLGSLRTYHEFLGTPTATSGAVTLSPSSGSPAGQVLKTVPTGNITSVTFSGFTTTASDGVNTDNQITTLTWIVEQGATPYTITMPTGNTQIKYAGGTSTVGATANTTTMISVSAYDKSGTTAYLVTISPEFSQV
jgi:hypothetical protein